MSGGSGANEQVEEVEDQLARVRGLLHAGDESAEAPLEEAAAHLGSVAAEAGLSVGTLVERVAGGGAGRAAAVAAQAWEEAREQQREAWLSYLTHEAKNPLNTVLNALWLLREHPGASGATRFLELAERGVRRIESSLKELRELHRNARSPAPTAPRVNPPPAGAASPP